MSQQQQQQREVSPVLDRSSRQDEIPSPATPPHLQNLPSLSHLLSNQQQHESIQAYIAATTSGSSSFQHHNESDYSQEYHMFSEEEEERDEMAEFEPGFKFHESENENENKNEKFVPTVIVPKKWWMSVDWKRTLRFVGLYMALPFVTGVMAGMGEIFANEAMYRWGWRGARPIQVKGRNNQKFPVITEK
ncbi:hypothetical protein BX661DRAFT_169109 [Kickxella alabastrina]|uniref:uncharacterized protein n=1 Tax=Kickxella alabastrina TaxID=61397 RepID=UPI0022205191|nr:uncharacterized protein BX661DRAFT_169109 [Kickxella alabastrina]KAI7833244.1 hypothetical protein BX661DRAFT_169109 [Kickxella alabastrina]